MTSLLFKRFGEIIERGLYSNNHKELVVTPQITSEEIRSKLSGYDFKKPIPLEKLFEDVLEGMKKWNVQVPHPNYFGLFNPATTQASILADAIVALFNPQVAAWTHAPYANEIEKRTLDFIAGKIGLPAGNRFCCFTTGGSEANMTATLAALVHHFPESIENGFQNADFKPVFYLSSYAHNSFDKISKNVGIGFGSMRKIPVDKSWKMDKKALVNQIERDISAGNHPFMIVATAGTTSAGIIDPLPEIAEICKTFNLWFHTDAAWAGAVALSNRLKPILEGIELSDSVTLDAHKWFSVPVGAGMFFTNRKKDVESAFGLQADYMPKSHTDTDEPYLTTIQWSRRFIGLKLFMTLAELGESGIENLINRFDDLGNYMRVKLTELGWIVLNPTELPLVCFTHPLLKNNLLSVNQLLETIYERGNCWISTVTLPNGDIAFRACITSLHTTEKNIDELIMELDDILNQSTQK